MPGTAFELELLEQHWLTDPSIDTCAHGTVRFRIGDAGSTIADLNTAFSARSLLRSLEGDRAADVHDPLFLHACNLTTGCPNVAIDWSVRHEGNLVRLGDAYAVDGSVGGALHAQPVRIPADTYRTVVIAFVRAVVEAYGPPEAKTFPQAWDREEFETFWADMHGIWRRYAAG